MAPGYPCLVIVIQGAGWNVFLILRMTSSSKILKILKIAATVKQQLVASWISLFVFCTFQGRLAASTSCFCHNKRKRVMIADGMLGLKGWKSFALEHSKIECAKPKAELQGSEPAKLTVLTLAGAESWHWGVTRSTCQALMATVLAQQHASATLCTPTLSAKRHQQFFF